MTNTRHIKRWLNEHGMENHIRVSTCVGLGMAVYLLFVATAFHHREKVYFEGLNEIYSVTTIAIGFVFGGYSGFYMSQWWSLRVATGSVAGCIADLSMILSGYLRPVVESVPGAARVSIAQKLKLAHMLHLCEILPIQHPAQAIAKCIGFKTDQESLIALLSCLLGEITSLVNMVDISEAARLSLLPSVQGNLSSIRSHAGDCTMILGTRYPRELSVLLFSFSAIHLLYFPIFLGTKSGWDLTTVFVVSSLAFVFIASFLLILAIHFRNPFLVNSFRLERIVSSTFDVIDQCFGTSDSPAPKSIKKKNRYLSFLHGFLCEFIDALSSSSPGARACSAGPLQRSTRRCDWRPVSTRRGHHP